MSILLEVDELSISFPRSQPVKAVSFSVARGATLAIVGESGSGKSLSALAIMSLLPGTAVASGRINFAGTDLLSLPEREMRRMRGRDLAMIFQEPMTSLNPVLTIGSQIAEVLRTHESLSRRQARARAIELLGLVRIAKPAAQVDNYPHQLSGGMRQRVMTAIAVACRPKLIIADEPTTALDVTIQAQILDLLDSLRRELEMALILITHDLGIVAQWADKVVVMYAGRKVEEGLPGALLERPLHPYTRGLLAASPRLDSNLHYRDGPLAEIPGPIVSAAGEPGCPFRPRCPEAREVCARHVPDLVVLQDRVVACPFVFAPTEPPSATAQGH